MADKHEHEHEHEHNHAHGCCDEHCEDESLCSCGEEHGESEALEKVLIAGGAVLFVAALALKYLTKLNPAVSAVLFILCAVACGIPTAVNAFKALIKKNITPSLLMVIAVTAAICTGDFAEGAAVALIYLIGEALEDYASERSKSRISSLFAIINDSGHLVKEDGTYEDIDSSLIEPGMKLALLPHEVIPVDGTVISGFSSIDTSAVTGESIPVEAAEGSRITGGCMNGDGTLIYEATASREQSGAARIISLVEEAASKKGKAQLITEKFSKIYTPVIIGIALLAFIIPSIITGDVSLWLHRALVILVASCPCSVVLSVPLAFLSAMGACAKNGTIIKGNNFIESLAQADTVLFDKTGTLTDSTPVAGAITPAEGFSEKEILALAAKCEYYSGHPIARAIIARAGEPDMTGTRDFAEIPGGGSRIISGETVILCGGRRLMEKENIDISLLPPSPVYVAAGGKAAGCIDIVNNLRPDTAEAVALLKKSGIKKTAVLTGDTAERTEKICAAAGIDTYESNLLPGQKTAALESFKDGSDGIIYIGDGINDAPVLAAADVGVAIGLDNEAAGEAADVILTQPDLMRLNDTINHSKRTIGLIKFNIAFAILVKAAVIIAGFTAAAPMWLAVAADVGTMIISVLNAARLLKLHRIRSSVTRETSI